MSSRELFYIGLIGAIVAIAEYYLLKAAGMKK